MHALLQCWFDSGLCLFVFFNSLFVKKKSNLENVTVWGFVWFFAMTITKGSFFSLTSTDVISEKCFIFVHSLYLFFFFFLTFFIFLGSG